VRHCTLTYDPGGINAGYESIMHSMYSLHGLFSENTYVRELLRFGQKTCREFNQRCSSWMQIKAWSSFADWFLCWCHYFTHDWGDRKFNQV